MQALPPSDYLAFLRQTVPANWNVDAPHIRLIAEHLDAVERGEIDRLAIHTPPRHGKTENSTIRYAVYSLTRRPTENVLVTGYNASFARKLGRKARTVARELPPGVLDLAADKHASDEWAVKAGGVLMARGVGSPPTGTGFSRIIIDDPIRKREDADSEAYREKSYSWYLDDIYTRLQPGGAIVMTATRWHEADVCAQAVASEPGRWTILKLPALAEANDLLGRPVGAALWPEQWPVEALQRIRDVMSQNEGERSWQALYQQNPTPREGSFFRPGEIRIEAAAPSILTAQCRAWDIASTESGGDYTAGVLMARAPDGLYWILDVRRGQWATDKRNKEIVQATALDGYAVRVHGPQDPGAAGKDAAAAFVRMLAGYSVKVEPVSGSKQTRADPFSAQVNAGNVRMVKAPWNKAFLEELRTFPLGVHDDQVDAASDAFNELAMGANSIDRVTDPARRRGFGFS